MINFYSLLFGVDFLTTQGHTFNFDEAIAMEKEEIMYLKSIVDKYLALVS